MKKVLLFNANPFLYGAEKGLLHIIKALYQKNRLTIVLPKPGPLAEEIAQISSDIVIRFFPLAIVRSFSPLYCLKYLFWFLINSIYFGYVILKEEIDIVCSNSLVIIFPAIICRILHKPCIWYAREYFNIAWLDRTLGYLAQNTASWTICQSKAIQTHLSLENSENTTIIYEPILESEHTIYDYVAARENLSINETATVIALISRIHPLKGQYEFLKEIAPILSSHKDIVILIAGEISPISSKTIKYKKRITTLLTEQNLTNVRLLGFYRDIDRLFSASDYCVFPFLRPEPFGIAITEAMSFQKPTYFNKTGGVKEISDIFRGGIELDIPAFKNMLSSQAKPSSVTISKLIIPEELSFEKYCRSIMKIFGP